MEPISFSITWAGSVTILGSVVAIVVGVLAILKSFKRPEKPKDYTTQIEKMEEEIHTLQNQITEIQTNLNGKIEIQVESLNNQISDIKTTLGRFQDKLERLTDLIIKNYNNTNK